MIIGHAIERLYPAVRKPAEFRETVIDELENELRQWISDTPSFFHPSYDSRNEPEQDFYDVPWIFKRQQRTVRSAFHFTSMLIYRGSLLREFLSHAPSTPQYVEPISTHVTKCVESAWAMASIAADIADDRTYNGVFWVRNPYARKCCAGTLILPDYFSFYFLCNFNSAGVSHPLSRPV